MKRLTCFCFVAVLLAGDTGTSIRPNASDYDAHQTLGDATIAASILPIAQAARLFSGAVSRKFTVVEIAIYPQTGRGFDVTAMDFALKTGPDDRIYSETPEQVAWQGKRAPSQTNPSLSGVHVAMEAGIAVGAATNTATGRTDRSVATYGGVEMDNRPQGNAPPQSAGADSTYLLESKLRGLELQEGQTMRPTSGYLYLQLRRSRKPRLSSWNIRGAANERY